MVTLYLLIGTLVGLLAAYLLRWDVKRWHPEPDSWSAYLAYAIAFVLASLGWPVVCTIGLIALGLKALFSLIDKPT